MSKQGIVINVSTQGAYDAHAGESLAVFFKMNNIRILLWLFVFIQNPYPKKIKNKNCI